MLTEISTHPLSGKTLPIVLSLTSVVYRLKMQKTMQTHAAVFRTGEVMREGIEKMNALWKDMANLKVSDRGMIWNR